LEFELFVVLAFEALLFDGLLLFFVAFALPAECFEVVPFGPGLDVCDAGVVALAASQCDRSWGWFEALVVRFLESVFDLRVCWVVAPIKFVCVEVCEFLWELFECGCERFGDRSFVVGLLFLEFFDGFFCGVVLV
jgi:hypothetical protein